MFLKDYIDFGGNTEWMREFPDKEMQKSNWFSLNLYNEEREKETFNTYLTRKPTRFPAGLDVEIKEKGKLKDRKFAEQ